MKLFYSIDGKHLTHFSKIAPSSRYKRRSLDVNIHELKRNYSSLTHVVVKIPQTDDPVSMTFQFDSNISKCQNNSLKIFYSFLTIFLWIAMLYHLQKIIYAVFFVSLHRQKPGKSQRTICFRWCYTLTSTVQSKEAFLQIYRTCFPWVTTRSCTKRPKKQSVTKSLFRSWRTWFSHIDFPSNLSLAPGRLIMPPWA